MGSAPLPQYALDLIALYGSPPSQPGDSLMGTAVLYEQVKPGTDVEHVALRFYQRCVKHDPRQDFINSRWMRTWKLLYQRTPEAQPNVFCELAMVAQRLDYIDRLGNDLGLYFYPEEIIGDWEIQRNSTKQPVLATVFDDPAVDDFRIYAIGDGEVLEGLLLLAGRTNGAVTALVLLGD